MRVIIAGGRDFNDYAFLLVFLAQTGLKPTEVVCGMAYGADSLGKRWAEEHHIPVAEYPANWEKYGKSAGYKRNVQMAENADCLVAFWDGKSRGTSSMIDIAQAKKLPVHIGFYNQA